MAGGRTIAPFVSTAWLAANSNSPNLVILDVRSAKAYKAGHIPGSISAPFGFPVSGWIVVRNKLFLELPDTAKLFKYIGGLGIGLKSRVVVVGAHFQNLPVPPEYGLCQVDRIALTLIYTGVPNVAILNGGFPKWKAEKRPVSLKAAKLKPVTFKGAVNRHIFVSMAYVRRHLKKAKLIDARDPDVYYGVVMTRWSKKAGHIPAASSLPAIWIWKRNKGGYYTYRDRKTLAAMAAGVLGKGENILYCGGGGYAATWWFVLTQALGKKNVKFYDGSTEEWSRHYNMVAYRWE